MPGFWEPCPGANNAITSIANTFASPDADVGNNEASDEVLSIPYKPPL
jgi:hypothetical protein